jgi:hypothetical protein
MTKYQAEKSGKAGPMVQAMMDVYILCNNPDLNPPDYALIKHAVIELALKHNLDHQTAIRMGKIAKLYSNA